MKRPIWLLITIVTLKITALVLIWAGWLQAKTPGALSSRPSNSSSHIKNQDSLSSDAYWRWRRCQPTHWRACLLQHE